MLMTDLKAELVKRGLKLSLRKSQYLGHSSAFVAVLWDGPSIVQAAGAPTSEEAVRNVLAMEGISVKRLSRKHRG